MFETQLGLRENPFAAGHQPRFVYPSREHQEALAHLRFGIENREPFVLITGEVGTGKTTAIYDALHGWGTRAVVALVTNSALTRPELLEEIAIRFGLSMPPGTSKPQLMVQLERHLLAIRQRNELAVLLLDEAQNLARDLLEEIRLLSNLENDGQKLLQIFLVGQPELEVILARPELRQLRQRIAVHYRLKPLSREETAHYIHHRVSVAGGNANTLFPPDTCSTIFDITHGIPREINTVCGQAMVNAYVEDSGSVRPEHALSVAHEGEFKSVIGNRGSSPSADDLLAAEQPLPTPTPTPVSDPAYPPVIAAPPPAPPPPLPPPPPPPVVVAPAPVVASTPPPVVAPIPPPAPATPPRAEAPAPPPPPPAPQPVVQPMPVHTPEPRAADPVREPDPVVPRPQPIEPPPSDEKPEIRMPSWIEEAIVQSQAREPLVNEAAPRDERVVASSAGTGSRPPENRPPGTAKPTVTPNDQEQKSPPTNAGATPSPATPDSASRPAPPARIAPSPVASTGTPYISSRLREKIMEADEEKKSAGGGGPWIAIGGVVLLVGLGIYFVMSSGILGGKKKEAAPPPAAPVAATPAPAEPTTPATTTPASTTPASTPTAAATKPATPPASKPATKPAATTPKPATDGDAAAAPAVKKSYGVAIGSYMDEARAKEISDQIAASASLPSQVMTVTEDGTTMYKVVVGKFDSKSAAENAGTDLIVKGLAKEARVTTVK